MACLSSRRFLRLRSGQALAVSFFARAGPRRNDVAEEKRDGDRLSKERMYILENPSRRDSVVVDVKARLERGD